MPHPSPTPPCKPFCFRALLLSFVNVPILWLFYRVFPHLHCSFPCVNPSFFLLPSFNCLITSIRCLVVVGGFTTSNPLLGALITQFTKFSHCKTKGNNIISHPRFQSYQACLVPLHMCHHVATPLLVECEDDIHIPEMGTWESSWTLKTSKFDCRGQNTLLWGIRHVIGKILKCRCRKWPRMSHLNICSTSYGKKKSRESN